MILQKLKYGSVFSAVEIAVDGHFYFLSLKKTKKELSIISKDRFSDLDQLIKTIKGIKHLFLILNHSKVLTKRVDAVSQSKENLTKTAFANIALSDFYYQTLEGSDFSLVSICRKESADTLISKFVSSGISVIGLSIGYSTFDSILPFLDGEYQGSGSTFIIEKEKLALWERSDHSSDLYNINGLSIESNYLVSLSGVLSYFAGIHKEDDTGLSKGLVKNYLLKRRFTLTLLFGLGFVFALVLINFFLFYSYGDKVSSLKEELVVGEVFEKQVKQLTQKTKDKRKLVDGIYSASNSKILWYINELAKSVPKSTSLDKIEHTPLQGILRKEKKALFTDGKITISGITKNETDFTGWTAELENKPWITKIAIKDIERKSSSSTFFDFVIELKPLEQ